MSEGRAMQEVRSLDERRLEIARKIAAGIEARRKGAPSLKNEHLALIDTLAGELSSEDIAEWKREVEQGYAEARPRFLWPGFGTKPAEQKPANEDVRPPETEAASSVSGKINRLLEKAGQACRKKAAEPAVEVEEKVEPVIEVEAATIERALVPVNRFASRIILPDVCEVRQIKEIVGLVNLKHQIVGNYGGRCMVVSWER